MKNTFGSNITVTLFGESHGEMIGAVIDGLTPGIVIDDDYIREKLALRRPSGTISTARREPDDYRIVSGAFGGFTTGTPLTVLIENTNTKSSDYESLRYTPRPGHADYTAECKYNGYQDRRGGGHFSGRVTAALVAAGAIISSALEASGVMIGTHISSLGGICDRPFACTESDIAILSKKNFPVIDGNAAEKMRKAIEAAAAEGDSVGGILETAVIGLPAGLGEPWFDTVEGVLSHALFSVPGIKGIEFGAGFGFANMRGSEANDPFRFEDGRVVTATNNNGGINGGITNGMPVIFRCAVKPTPSIFKRQDTVDLKSGENTTLELRGRHDPAIIHRARAVVDAVTAIAIADLLASRYGSGCLGD
ncbi:MAG: chorismate synthase [Clostridia bacterium]|nr:chorismate synthase [Clostridia bacterium]